MCLCVAVVVDTHKQTVIGVLPNFCHGLTVVYLLNCILCILTTFQLNNQRGLIHVFAGQKHQVGKALARSQLAEINEE